MADRAPPRRRQDLEELGMQGRLAAGDLHQVRLSFRGDQRVQHPLDLLQRAVGLALHGRVRETHGAGQVAGLIDLEDGEARVLFVVRAEAAVERAAVIGPRLGAKGPVAGLQPVLLRFPVGEVVADQRLLHAVFAAALLVEDVRALRDDLGRNQVQACFTQAGGLAQEQIGRALARHAGRGGLWRSRSIHRRSVRGLRDETD